MEVESVQEPEHLLCSITFAMYRDPVFVPESGNTYEREALVQYWRRSPKPRDPLSNSKVTNTTLHSNWAIRREVHRFLDANPTYTPQGWPNRTLPPLDSRQPAVYLKRPSASSMKWIYVVAIILAFPCCHYFGSLWADTEIGKTLTSEARSTSRKLSPEDLKPPKHSQIQAWNVVDATGESLSVRLPPSPTAWEDAAYSALRSMRWSICMILWVWCSGRCSGRQKLMMYMFNLVMLLYAAGKPFTNEVVVLKCNAEAGGGNLLVNSEVFGWTLHKKTLEVTALHDPPAVVRGGWSSAELLFLRDGGETMNFHTLSALRKDEADWFRQLFTSSLTKCLKDADINSQRVR